MPSFRKLSSGLSSTKPFYVTSPIFYVNAKPHLGHLYSMLLCDSRNRWEKLNPSRKSYFLTGTDEHGLKIQEVAAKQGVECKALVDQVSNNFKNLAEKLNIHYDRFMRTTDKDHIKAVEFFWDLMEKKSLIYEGSHNGWYSVSDETFYPESQIENVIDQKSGKSKRISKESKNEVFYHEEINYFFKLSQFQENLIHFLESHPEFILPASKYNEVLKELKDYKLTDLSISRPSSRLSWGIPVPNDPSQTIYVWFDALLNYATAAGFPQSFVGEDNKFIASQDNIWPATHVIGKDITRFHCIYWPIMLMAAGIELPKQIIVHSHWLSEGFKMSKSLGNVVDPIATFDYYGEDSLRFFLIENSNIATDCNYSERAFHATRENIIGKYANLITRSGGSAFDIEGSVQLYKQGKFENIDQIIRMEALNQEEVNDILILKNELHDNLNKLYGVMNDKFMRFDQMKAIQEWWVLIEKANQFFQMGQPWLYTKAMRNESITKSKKESFETLQSYYVFMAAETCRITSILIQPVMPSLSNKILDRLAVDQAKRNSNFCIIGGDVTYGGGANSKEHKIPIERIPIRDFQN